MKVKYIPKIKAMKADSAEEFERRFNELIEDLGHPHYTINISDGKFFAIIEYQEEKRTIMNLIDS